MSSLSISFNDEHPKQGHLRSNMIQKIIEMIKEDPNIFGSSITLSFYKKGKPTKWNYCSGIFDSTQVNELEDCLIQSDELLYNYGGNVKVYSSQSL